MAAADDLADDLYTLPPSEFVAARTAAVASARSAGDKAGAVALAALRKPTVTAWLANRVVRTRPDLIRAAIDLGAEMRDATVAGDRDALRALARRRAQLFGEVVGQARTIAAEHDQAMTAETQRELESCLTAAAADPAAADLLLSGRLTSPLSFEGLGFDQGAVPPVSDAPARRREPESTRTAKPATDTAPAPKPGRSKATSPTSTREKSSAATTRDRASTSTPGRSRSADDAERARAAQEAARARAVQEAEQALAVARLQQADADAELATARRVLDEAVAAESEAASAYEAAQVTLVDARADVRDATKDATTASRTVAAALARLDRATRRH